LWWWHASCQPPSNCQLKQKWFLGWRTPINWGREKTKNFDYLFQKRLYFVYVVNVKVYVIFHAKEFQQPHTVEEVPCYDDLSISLQW
jgi:hypothetical protein